MKVWPATVKVPVREEVLVFEATEKFTAPVAVPLLPEVIVIQEALLVAVQEHPEPAVTLTVPVPPEGLKDLLEGLSE